MTKILILNPDMQSCRHAEATLLLTHRIPAWSVSISQNDQPYLKAVYGADEGARAAIPQAFFQPPVRCGDFDPDYIDGFIRV